MASYSVELKPSVEKDLRALPRATIQRILKRIAALTNEPISRQSVKLTGAQHLYRIRSGDYRIVYGVDHDSKLVTVHYVRHRKDAYREM
jgi:mRNA interferase RelE/StbE